MMDEFKAWVTYRLVKLASQLHGGMFMRMCEVAVLAQHREAIEALEEAVRDADRLEQEHDHDSKEEHTYGTFH